MNKKVKKKNSCKEGELQNMPYHSLKDYSTETGCDHSRAQFRSFLPRNSSGVPRKC